MTDKQLERIQIKLRWGVYNKKFSAIKGFAYNGFKYILNIEPIAEQEKFCAYFCEQETIVPWEMCQFLSDNNIKFKLRFIYSPRMDIKNNLCRLRIVVGINSEIARFYIKRFFLKLLVKISRGHFVYRKIKNTKQGCNKAQNVQPQKENI